MALDFGLVGAPSAPRVFTYGWKDAVLYALGVGARLPDELEYLYEGAGPRVLPTFAVVPSFDAMVDVASRLGANMAMVVHGEQTIRLHRPIPPRGTLATSAVVTGIYDKGKGALCVVEAKTTDDAGQPVFDNVFSIFVRGAGGFGGDRGPEALAAEPPERAPDLVITEKTAVEQAALYRLSGDLNPLHIAPDLARAVGFERPILHGLCTYGFAGRALVRGACSGDPARLRSFSARFSAPVLPGDELTTQAWDTGGGRWIVRVVTQDGRTVLSNSVAEVGA